MLDGLDDAFFLEAIDDLGRIDRPVCLQDGVDEACDPFRRNSSRSEMFYLFVKENWSL